MWEGGRGEEEKGGKMTRTPCEKKIDILNKKI